MNIMDGHSGPVAVLYGNYSLPSPAFPADYSNQILALIGRSDPQKLAYLYSSLPPKCIGKTLCALLKSATPQQLLDCLESMDERTREFYFGCFMASEYEAERSVFSEIALKIIDSDLSPECQKRLFALIFGSLDNYTLDRVTECAAHQLDAPSFFRCVARLQDERLVKSLLKAVLNVREDQICTLYKKLLLGIAAHIPPNQAACPFAFKHLLDIRPNRLK